MGYAYYVDDVRYAYRVDLDTGAPERFQHGTLAWVPISGLGELMALISNGDAAQTTEANCLRTVEIIKEVKAREDAGDDRGVLLELEVAAEYDARKAAV